MAGAFFGLGVLLGLSYGAPKLGEDLETRGDSSWKTYGQIWEIHGKHQQIGILPINQYHEMMDNLIYNGKTTSALVAFVKIWKGIDVLS